ncbi:ParB/RepB/Spo0J family partition protein [Bifidobacterium sp. SMB2]|uniref:ParB/RepB/Spo0J family partition protein n=1 Tax=Bifidobacterium saimiriisciurei TaxID=2661627 RepID=A0ABX0CCV2_9BIFI|nr:MULTISPECIES: ParB/RepB/Spo0J family partition protein [Bifidobacterium]NEG95522.1 ParB/RepB/Spo0J family partition protein [Bifidobacterium sp. SMB2]NEH11680.1 ParB/RepB/Spo0J family partition protein [Bifidobacterium saimiriisciurei]
MAARSRRLGKGLGALFPSLPGEEPEEKKPAAPAADSAAAKAPRTDSGTTAAADATKSVKPVKSTQRNRAEAGGEASGSKGAAGRKGKRPSMPSLVDSLHPSDMFFGGDSSDGTSSSTGVTPSALSDLIAPTRPLSSQIANAAARPEAAAAAAAGDHAGSGKGGGKSATKATGVKKTSAKSAERHDASESADSSAEGPKPVAGGYLAELSVTDITPNDHQPRQIFDEDELLELSRSIQEVGVLQPIVVRKRTAEAIAASESKAPYELIMGERRWRATQLAKLKTIPAIVKTTSDTDMLRDALLENLHRVALNPLEEAAAYQQMLSEFGLTQEQLSKSVSKSRPQIANTLRLLQLPASVQKKVSAGVLSAGHARALLGLSNPERMEELANKIIAEGLSVRTTEEIVATEVRQNPDGKKKPRRQNVWADSPALHSLENRFDTKVAIRGSKKKGRIEITFASEEDFDRILQLLGSEHQSGEATDGKDDGWI